MRRLWLIALTICVSFLLLRPDLKAATPELWFYYSINLNHADDLPKLESVFRRAAAAGYTQVHLNDYHFGCLQRQEPTYFKNVEQVKALAAELHLEIVPAIFPIGRSESLLSLDPNLAESMPVRDALFVVTKGEAHPVADPPVQFPDDFCDPKKWNYIDPVVHFENGVAHVSGADGAEGVRVMKTLAVAPFHQYHISFRIKTLNYTAPPVVQVLSTDDAESLNAATLDVKPVQDWTRYDVVFNSLEQTKVLISFRAGYTGSSGELWWDRPLIEEAGLVNLVRRDSAPLLVRTEDGKVLTESKDYAPISDPKMGYASWAGAYDVWHEPPVLKTPGLPDDTRLRVSYEHAVVTMEGGVNICPSEAKTVDILRDQAKRMEALFHAKRYFMQHDEIRVLGWDDADAARHLESGAILADNVHTCIQIMKEVAPQAQLYVWSDMFDPNVNAHAHYYLVKGNLAGSWEGLDPSVVIANWHFDPPEKTLAWFAGRGHHQLLAGYYDAPPERILDWLNAARNTPHIDAVMYTTWENNYADLERFALLVKSFH